MKHLLLAAFLSNALLLNTPDPGDDDLDPQTDTGTGDSDQNDEFELPDLDERIELFLYGRTGRRDHDDVRAALTDPEIIAGSEGYASGLMTELDDRDHQLAEQTAEVERQRLASEREAMKVALKKELADQAVTTAKTTEDQRVRDELLAEIAAEDAAASGTPAPNSEDALYVDFEESLKVVRDPNATPEEKLAAANKGIESARQLEIAAPGAPVDFDPDDFLAEFNARKEK